MEEKILLEIKKYIEVAEQEWDGEHGMGRKAKELIESNEMPELYNKVCKLLVGDLND